MKKVNQYIFIRPMTEKEIQDHIDRMTVSCDKILRMS